MNPILQTLLCSSDEEERKFGICKLLFIRGEQDLGEEKPIPRRTPEINLQAISLFDFIDWKTNLYEPLLTCSLTKEDIMSFLDTSMLVKGLLRK